MNDDKTKEIKRDHAEPNPLYELALDGITREIERITEMLSGCASINVEMGVNSAYRALCKLRDNLQKGQA